MSIAYIQMKLELNKRNRYDLRIKVIGTTNFFNDIKNCFIIDNVIKEKRSWFLSYLVLDAPNANMYFVLLHT